VLKGNAALAALWAALDEGHEAPPPDSITQYDLMEKRGISRSAAQNELDRKVVAGILQSGMFYTKGKKNKTRHYWLPKGKK
jgi:hypothetical protein